MNNVSLPGKPRPTPQLPHPADVRKIAVLRANALGDFIFTLPALEALKRHFSNAEIVYLGNAWHREFLHGRPGPVDRVVVVPRCKGIPHETDDVEDAAAVERFFTSMRSEHFDIAFQMHGGGGNSNPFVARLGAKLGVGLQAAGAPPLDVNVPYTLYHSEVLRYLELVRATGVRRCDPEPQLTITARDRDSLARALPDLPRNLVVLHPGATDPRRCWSTKRFAAVGDELARAGLQIAVTGTDGERGRAEQLTGGMQQPALNLAGRLNLGGLAALLAHAKLVISNDTGPLHLARAVNTPTIGIYWMGNMITGGPMSVATNRCCIAWETHCPRCGFDCVRGDAHAAADGCDHAVSFVDSVSAEQVLEHAQDLLPASGAGRALRIGCA